MTAWSAAVDREQRSITITLSDEPPNLNSATSTDSLSIFVLGHVMQGLTEYDKTGKIIGAVASTWQKNGLTYTFQLRKDAKWSDGKTVVAQDFIYAWRHALKPSTASSYAFILFAVKNAEAINRGRLPVEKLGIRAISDYELEVVLEKPTPYFLDLISFHSYYPLRQDIIEKYGDSYAAEAQNMVFNGPFTLQEWVHGASLKMVKNPHYWAANSVWLETINVGYITSDTRSIFNLFRDGQIALAGLGRESIDLALIYRMHIQSFTSGALSYLEFNHRPSSPFSNINLRRALQAILDPADLVYKVIGLPGIKPAYSFFPSWLRGVEKSFILEYPPKRILTDTEQAKRYFATAKEELGNIPPITLLVDDDVLASKLAEHLQNKLKRILGLDIRIDKQIFKQRLAKMSQGKFDLVVSGWGPDYNDLNTFGDLLTSYNENNHGKYKSAKYDSLVRKATLAQGKERVELFARMQDILIEDAAVIPRYETGGLYVQHPKLKGVVRRVIGADPYFVNVYIADD